MANIERNMAEPVDVGGSRLFVANKSGAVTESRPVALPSEESELMRGASRFERTLFNIANIQNLPDSLDKTTSLDQEKAGVGQRPF